MNLNLWRAFGGGELEAMGEEPATDPVKKKRRGGRRKAASAPVTLERGPDTGDLDLRMLAGAPDVADVADGADAGDVGGDGAGAGRAGWRIPAARPYLDDPTWAPEPMEPGVAGEARDDSDLPWWLALNRVRGVGPARFRLLVEFFGSARAAWEAQPGDWRAIGMDERTSVAFGRQRKQTSPDAEMELMAQLRVAALRVVDATYPRLLKEIPAPPPVIYVRGRLEPGDELALAVVGTRRVSAYGRTVTERLVSELAAQGVTIVSGLARGVDTCAHTAALAAGGRTIAVQGCGPDLVYPPENARLAARIVEQGAVVTEFPPQTQPEAGNFPARNRIISGLSLATLVIEAPAASGALITARFAAEQGRDVFAVPGAITSPGSGGVNRLIQDGAKLIMAPEDIFIELNVGQAPQEIALREVLPADATEAALVTLLRASGDPQHIDDLCRASGLPTARVSGALAMMDVNVSQSWAA
ncbi:MAG TPA: DNA-processing protein DprA [Ktedonobacterales bacterium]